MRSGPPLRFSFDGQTVAATTGDSVLSALLQHGALVRTLEFGGEPRAGFCLMGACQDCWVWTADGGRIRACTTLAAQDMELFAQPQPFPQAHG